MLNRRRIYGEEVTEGQFTNRRDLTLTASGVKSCLLWFGEMCNWKEVMERSKIQSVWPLS